VISKEIKELVTNTKADTSGKWINREDVEDLLYKVLRECVTIVEDTPRHCAFTTHDLGLVECTVEMSAEQLRKRFGLKKYYGVINEGIMGREISS